MVVDKHNLLQLLNIFAPTSAWGLITHRKRRSVFRPRKVIFCRPETVCSPMCGKTQKTSKRPKVKRLKSSHQCTPVCASQ